MRTTVGQRLCTARLARGLSQAQLASTSGVSTQTISDVERGVHATPRLSTVVTLARVLDIAPFWLVSTDPDAPGGP